MRLTFLGTGTSNGIPVIGCDCAVCRSEDPHDRRSRTSAVVSNGAFNVLIDTAPELRVQALANGLRRVDAVLYTHAHADHVGGFDDLRSFNLINQDRLPVYADAPTAALLLQRFGYAFEHPFPFYGGKPDLDLHIIDGSFELGALPVMPIPVTHGRWLIHGFRFGDLVYVTDAKTVPDTSLELMRDADVLVLNALRDRPHPVHLSVDEALEIIAEVRPRRAYLVHLSHDLGHAVTNARLPEHVRVAHDGLVVEVGTALKP
jgi:phosphoribosyl 1,2-cyclic phosphate phosphodiesterase